MKNLLYILSLSLLLFAGIGCSNSDATSVSNAPNNFSNTAAKGYHPDNNPATYDENPQNPPISEMHTYNNIDGKEVQAPTLYKQPPPAACAICKNGEYSFSLHRRGTCSHQGGVAKWLKEL